MKSNYKNYEKKSEHSLQDISLRACLEADKLYEKFYCLMPEYLNLISGIMCRLLAAGEINKAFVIAKAMYILTDTEEPDYFKSIEKQKETLEYFLNEFYLDWKERVEQAKI